MKRLAAMISTTAIAFMAIACNQPADTHYADVQAIKDNEAQWNKDYEAKDLDKIAAHYADDATLMAPGTPSSTGKDAVKAALKEMVADPALSLKFMATKVDVAKSGDVGYTQGAYTLTVTDPQSKQVIHDHGSYVTVYRKQADGSWKAVSDIASSEVPPIAPAPAPKKRSRVANRDHSGSNDARATSEGRAMAPKTTDASAGKAAVEAYLRSVPGPARTTLEKLRATIRAAAPKEATEGISYAMPAFRYKGALVAYAAFKQHCSLFPMSGRVIEEFAEELKGYKTSKGTIQFGFESPIPASLVKKIVKARVARNDEKSRG